MVVNEFDVASLNEIKLINKIYPEAKLHFMHTVKSKAEYCICLQ